MKKLFIVGCSRSGTTVLQQGLNRHSLVAIPPETKFFWYFYGQSKSRQAAHLRRINQDLKIELPYPDRRIRGPRDARAFYRRMAEQYLERLGREDVAYFGEKTPEHTGHLHRISEVFPHAKIIFMVRDGRDVALSLSRMPWIRCDVYVGFLVWLYYYRVLKRWRQDGALETYFLRYEDLVRDPAAEFEGVLRFLGLPYEPLVAEGWGNQEGIPEREYPWKARALKRIGTDRIDLWRDELSSVQVERLERMGRRALTDLGYTLSLADTRRLSPWFLARLGWGLTRCVVRLPLCGLRNELLGSGSRLLSALRPHRRRAPLTGTAGQAEDEASWDVLHGSAPFSVVRRTRENAAQHDSSMPTARSASPPVVDPPTSR